MAISLINPVANAVQLQPAVILKITVGNIFRVNIDSQKAKLIDTLEKYKGYKL